jgi:hypothetical protein
MENMRKLAETKVKIIKNKLITLYDGNIDIARDLSTDELIDHVAFRINSVCDNKNKRGSSYANRPLNRSPDRETHITPSHYEPQQMEYKEAQVDKRGYSCGT